MRRCLFLWCLAALMLLPAWAIAQGSASATVDRPQLAMGETLTLTINIDGDAPTSMPDLSGLGQDFTILGTSNNRSISIINGARSMRTSIGVALRPNHPGQVTIPAIAVGGRMTSPVRVTVGAASAPTAGSPGARDGPVIVEGSVDTQQAVVGQQIIYTLRLFYAVDLTDGSLGDPHADGLEVRHLESDGNFQAQRGGNTYRVLERHYALFPQHAGTVQIPAVGFQGQALDRRNPDAFFDGTSPVNVGSNTVELKIAEPPATAGNGAWLPASSLALTLDGLPADGKARVGAPLTLSLQLEATGLPFEVLPAPTLPALTGADVYPDKAVTGTRDDGRTLIGKRQQGFAVVPDRAGALTIPEITVHWYDVKHGQMQTASVPAHTLQVEAAAGAPATPLAPAASVAPAAATPPAVIGTDSDMVHGTWFRVAVGALVLWLLTVLAGVLFWWSRRRRAPAAGAVAPRASARGLRNSFLAAARANDALRQEQALLTWARSERPLVRSLGDLSAGLGDSAQQSAIASLQRIRFGAPGAVPAGSALVSAFKDGFHWRATTEPPPDDLPALYP